MSASPILNSPPPRRPPPEERVQTRSSGPASSPCALCSPPAREFNLRSPLDGRMCASEDPAAPIIEAWCAPTLVSPAGRPCSVLQLAERQAAGPVDIRDTYLEDEQWDMEAMVLATIAGQLEDEEEEEEEEEIRDMRVLYARLRYVGRHVGCPGGHARRERCSWWRSDRGRLRTPVPPVHTTCSHLCSHHFTRLVHTLCSHPLLAPPAHISCLPFRPFWTFRPFRPF